jgi:hypothetical protein
LFRRRPRRPTGGTVRPTSVPDSHVGQEEARRLRGVPPRRRGARLRERAAGGRGHGRAAPADPRDAGGGAQLGAAGRVGGVGEGVVRHLRRRRLPPRRRAAADPPACAPRRRRGDRRRARARRAGVRLRARLTPPRRVARRPLQPSALMKPPSSFDNWKTILSGH